MSRTPYLNLSPRLRGMGRVALVALAATTLILPLPAFSQKGGESDPLVDVVADGKGRINYANGVVKATGYGAPPSDASSPAQSRLMAMGAAKADALRNLAMSVSSIQVTAETKVKNYVLENDTVKTQLSAILQSPRLVSEKYQPDGTAVVVMELPMYGPNSVASVILPEVLQPSDSARNTPNMDAVDGAPRVRLPDAAPGVDGARAGGAGADKDGNFKGPKDPAIRINAPKSAPRPAPLAVEPGLTPLSDSGPFSAVIVDCRGLGVEAIMSPKLFDTAGREVYGTVRVAAEYAIETGIVSYPRSMTEAVRSARSGKHPLIVRAVRTADKFRFNPVISMEDADRILAANNREHFLEQTRVIFLVDPLR